MFDGTIKPEWGESEPNRWPRGLIAILAIRHINLGDQPSP